MTISSLAPEVVPYLGYVFEKSFTARGNWKLGCLPHYTILGNPKLIGAIILSRNLEDY